MERLIRAKRSGGRAPRVGAKMGDVRSIHERAWRMVLLLLTDPVTDHPRARERHWPHEQKQRSRFIRAHAGATRSRNAICIGSNGSSAHARERPDQARSKASRFVVHPRTRGSDSFPLAARVRACGSSAHARERPDRPASAIEVTTVHPRTRGSDERCGGPARHGVWFIRARAGATAPGVTRWHDPDRFIRARAGATTVPGYKSASDVGSSAHARERR